MVETGGITAQVFEEEKRRFFAEKKKEYNKRRGEFWQREQVLPARFRRRIQHIRKTRGDVFWLVRTWELDVCEEAVNIAEIMRGKSEEEILALKPKDIQTVHKGHSGTSWAHSVQLAAAYLRGEELIAEME